MVGPPDVGIAADTTAGSCALVGMLAGGGGDAGLADGGSAILRVSARAALRLRTAK